MVATTKRTPMSDLFLILLAVLNDLKETIDKIITNAKKASPATINLASKNTLAIFKASLYDTRS